MSNEIYFWLILFQNRKTLREKGNEIMTRYLVFKCLDVKKNRWKADFLRGNELFLKHQEVSKWKSHFNLIFSENMSLKRKVSRLKISILTSGSALFFILHHHNNHSRNLVSRQKQKWRQQILWSVYFCHQIAIISSPFAKDLDLQQLAAIVKNGTQPLPM